MGKRQVAILAIAGAGGLAWWLSRQQDGGGIAPVDLGPWSGGVSMFGPIDGPPVEAPTLVGVGSIVESFFQGIGFTPDQASGVAAGVWAESRFDPNAVNPTSGAYGIGQWLGSRKAELFAQYGPNPGLYDQLQFLAWELTGGDKGGAAVLAQDTATGTLDAYIRKFMRPGAGTAGDLARGAGYLG